MNSMENSCYPFVLPPLPFGYSALEPYIDAETMHYHHDKHFATYINKLNAALEPYPELHRVPLCQLLTHPLPEEARIEILQNAGGVYNHNFFFNHLSPEGDYPSPEIKAELAERWGSYDAFKEAFTKAALDVFGSGWVCLTKFNNKIAIVTLPNQETIVSLSCGFSTPALMMDVWEHAYYLKYKNDRANYIKNLWNIIDFTKFW